MQETHYIETVGHYVTFFVCVCMYLCCALCMHYYDNDYKVINSTMHMIIKNGIHKYMNEDKSNKYTTQLSNQFIFLLGSLGIGMAKD